MGNKSAGKVPLSKIIALSKEEGQPMGCAIEAASFFASCKKDTAESAVAEDDKCAAADSPK